ncbi:hypothetical protein PHLCEN_2v8013 [Hermanssonia centrifuga]|uniref:Uncharacterized protein n=1 Tax=Hermanssonia centrifuga TaxID=98765 RepID=A0A2R6NUY5_9APHY|nr:hypothetical protein PHLCEN_2v8013 [Hermanssonia centrifuga]
MLPTLSLFLKAGERTIAPSVDWRSPLSPKWLQEQVTAVSYHNSHTIPVYAPCHLSSLKRRETAGTIIVTVVTVMKSHITKRPDTDAIIITGGGTTVAHRSGMGSECILPIATIAPTYSYSLR